MNQPNKHPSPWWPKVLSALLVLFLATPSFALKDHDREGWLVGVSYGYSRGHIEWASDSQGVFRGGAIPQIRIGRMVGSRVALGLDYHGWMLEGGAVPVKLRSSLQSLSLAATWYPGQAGSALGGFYVRGGAGFGWAGLTLVEIDEIPPEKVPLDQEHGDRTDETGLALNLQVGYEFRVSGTFAAGLGMGFDHLSIDKDIYKSSYYFPFTLTGVWYWD